MSFMMEIDASRRRPLDQLAVDFFYAQRSGTPSIDFCRQVYGVPESDAVVAQRLSVAVSTVRGWREVGRRATPGPRSCL
jgi:DNA-binding transcriptional regulator YiaG